MRLIRGMPADGVKPRRRQAAALVRSGNWVDYGTALAQPDVFDAAPGNVLTTPRTDMMYLVTEYGCVNLKGLSIAGRARVLIGLVHPDFREGLERQAREHGLIPRSWQLALPDGGSAPPHL
jgi:acyl-CoA hydrolase